MKKSIFCIRLLLFGALFSFSNSIGFSQSKEIAISNLKTNFENYFVKTPVYRDSKESKSAFTYDYLITDQYIAIKCTEAGVTEAKWTTMFYKDIEEFKSGESNFYFKKQTNLLVNSNYALNFGSASMASFDLTKAFKNNTTFAMIPFNFTNDPTVLNALNSDLEIIKKVMKSEEKLKQDQKKDSLLRLEDEKMKALPFHSYKVFTLDSSQVNLKEYMQKNRKFADKPTLVLFYGFGWCSPCLSKMDSIIQTGVTLKYNLVFLNIDATSDFSDIKSKVISKNAKYEKEAILVFDRNDETKEVHHHQAPTYLWLDAELNVRAFRNGVKINLPQIERIFQSIE